ncbi:spidroin-2-like [Schistocerca gregaria]|uniref:spidroin-2-like n=1 Tax=Schistocerca gregaria TaxID=7010 RepID=UPI00211EAAE8|nr:spidroin-2-like [Schistocerca gregaria]
MRRYAERHTQRGDAADGVVSQQRKGSSGGRRPGGGCRSIAGAGAAGAAAARLSPGASSAASPPAERFQVSALLWVGPGLRSRQKRGHSTRYADYGRIGNRTAAAGPAGGTSRPGQGRAGSLPPTDAYQISRCSFRAAAVFAAARRHPSRGTKARRGNLGHYGPRPPDAGSTRFEGQFLGILPGRKSRRPLQFRSAAKGQTAGTPPRSGGGSKGRREAAGGGANQSAAAAAAAHAAPAIAAGPAQMGGGWLAGWLPAL